MTVLVTGGCGFVGINVGEALLAKGERAVLFDRNELPSSAARALREHGSGLSVVTGDVRDAVLLERVFRDHGIDRVIHTAVITADAVRESHDPNTIIDVNVRGTVNVLEAARSARCQRVVYVSSGQAYGKTHDEGVPLSEEISPSRPDDVYGITKFAAEQMTLRLGVLWKLPVVCVRLGSVCGPWEFDTGVRDMLTPHLQTARMAMKGETAILPRKEFWRDWVYSRDVANGLVAVLQAKELPHNVYHLSSGIDWRGSFAQWCETLKAAYPDFSWRIAAVDEQPNVSFVVARDRAPMDMRRMADDIGFKPRFGPREAYSDYIGWIQKHPDFIAGQLK